ncbi:MAG: hypothetical protein ABIP42_05695, partial [Planctomycetota bacterium]
RLVGARFEYGRMATMLALVLSVMAATLWIDSTLTPHALTAFTMMTGVKAAVLLAITGAVWRLLLHADERAQLSQRVRAKLRVSGP